MLEFLQGFRVEGPWVLVAALVYETLVAIWIRLLAEKKPRRILMVSLNFVNCIIWGFAIPAVVLDPFGKFWYAAGASVGTLIASYVERK